jgi:hypothetical protein
MGISAAILLLALIPKSQHHGHIPGGLGKEHYPM